jgi:hypothetical protein
LSSRLGVRRGVLFHRHGNLFRAGDRQYAWAVRKPDFRAGQPREGRSVWARRRQIARAVAAMSPPRVGVDDISFLLGFRGCRTVNDIYCARRSRDRVAGQECIGGHAAGSSYPVPHAFLVPLHIRPLSREPGGN